MRKRSFTNRMKDLFRAPHGVKKSPLKERRLAVEPLETRTLLAIVSMTPADGNPSTIIERQEGSCTVNFSVQAEGDEDLTSIGQIHVSYSIGGLDSYEYDDGGCGDGTVTIWANLGQTSAAVTVSFFNDAKDDGNDTCTISLTGAVASDPYGGGGCCGDGCWCGDGGGGGDGISFSVDQDHCETSVTIVDDDSWLIEVEATPDEIVERDGASGYSISRVDDGSGESGDTTYAIAVDFTMSGAADYGADYNLSGDSGYAIPADWNATTEQWEWHVTIPPGSGGVGVGLGSVNDAAREADEDATLSIADATSTNNWDDGGCCGGGCTTTAYHGPDETFGQAGPDASVTIQDDDGWALEIERTSGEVIVERTGEASLVLRRVDDGDGRSGDTSYGILVDLDPSGGAAAYGTDFGLYDEDGYYLGYWTATIPAGDTATSLQLVSNNDHLWEADEDAVIAVTGGTSVGVSGGVFAAGQAHPDASVLILDDDHWVVTLEEAGEAGDPHTVIQEEGQTSAGLLLSRTHEVMTPSRTGDTSYPINVTFAYSGHANTNDYTMYKFAAPSGVVPGGTPSFQIPEGQEWTSILVTAIDDVQIERLKELLVIAITNATHAAESYIVSTSENEVELEIADNDTLELERYQFQDVRDLHSDPLPSNHAGVSWQQGLHWHKDRQLGDNLTEDYVPLVYSSSDVLKENAQWLPAEVDPAIANDLFAFFEVYIDGVRYSSTVSLEAALNGSDIWYTADPAELGESFAAFWGQTARYRECFVTEWFFFVGSDVADVASFDPQDGLSTEEYAVVRETGDGTSCLYVTYRDPAAPVLHHTIVHTGCEAADGVAGGESAVFDAIWSEVETLQINKINIEDGAVVEGEVLSYYGKDVEAADEAFVKSLLSTVVMDTDGDGDFDSANEHQEASRAREFSNPHAGTLTDSVAGLLIKYDGTCNAWMKFAGWCFAAQGIGVSPAVVSPAGTQENVGFRVDASLEGQGGAVPRENIFRYHKMVFYNGKMYDPSYGVVYDTVTDFVDILVDIGEFHGIGDISLDAALIPHLGTLQVGGMTITTLKGYGYAYEPTDSSPSESDIDVSVF